MREWIAGLDAGAERLGVDADDLRLALFAFAALADEIVLGSALPVRDEWRRRPLQLELFGEQLAGERFFEHLDRLREQGARRLPVLQVFHLALLLGFQGRFALDNGEALAWTTSRLGDEIARWRGGRAALAPHAEPPDRIVHRLRRQWPPWASAVFVVGVALLALGVLQYDLAVATERALAPHQGVVRALRETAHLSIEPP
ncbi:MAG: DotU family type IV/VI secretion system protein [Comamonadaceae bacterium]|nr:DotU family type IV/VI secretion system protein [Comamonadaceae bacterium]